jgi:hypothetical protein
MPEDRSEAECSGATEDSEAAEQSAETDEAEQSAETEAAAAERRARLEAAKRSYRATLRNEADTGGGGFSEDYYRSQKPPHWS